MKILIRHLLQLPPKNRKTIAYIFIYFGLIQFGVVMTSTWFKNARTRVYGPDQTFLGLPSDYSYQIVLISVLTIIIFMILGSLLLQSVRIKKKSK